MSTLRGTYSENDPEVDATGKHTRKLFASLVIGKKSCNFNILDVGTFCWPGTVSKIHLATLSVSYTRVVALEGHILFVVIQNASLSELLNEVTI